MRAEQNDRSIKIKKDTERRLQKMRLPGQPWDETINQLLDVYEQHKFKEEHGRP
jgi:hypothetical protein